MCSCFRRLLLVVLRGTLRSPQTDGKLTIAVIPKGTSHVFWQSIHAGAEKAASELGVDVIWRGPLREDDRDSQVSEVEGFVSRGVAGHRARAARRGGARAAGGRCEAAAAFRSSSSTPG